MAIRLVKYKDVINKMQCKNKYNEIKCNKGNKIKKIKCNKGNKTQEQCRNKCNKIKCNKVDKGNKGTTVKKCNEGNTKIQ